MLLALKLFVPLKNNKTRTVQVAPFIIDILKAERTKQAETRLLVGELWEGWQNAKERQTALVFTNEVGRHLIQNTVVAHFKKIVGSIGAPETRVHDLRHTFAVLSLQNGDDFKTVQENLGHATASFTLDIYGHVSKKMKQDSADRMQQYISKIGNE
ncbi:MAG: tyrosine-type recombinase/integrase [Oscillospiraceae bacterium]